MSPEKEIMLIGLRKAVAAGPIATEEWLLQFADDYQGALQELDATKRELDRLKAESLRSVHQYQGASLPNFYQQLNEDANNARRGFIE